jgi:23S rRNA (pseudouridine1915-N3)-methyltransferase
MRVTIAAIGSRLPDWADSAVADFLERFPPEFSVALRTAKAPARNGKDLAALRSTEAARLRALLPDGAVLLALDEKGRARSSAEFAADLQRWSTLGQPLGFVIGGADGLEPQLLGAADAVLSLSPMTLPHALARVLLVEQLYRAWSIGAGHPYHRG